MSFTRRDILVGLLGLSAGSACKRRRPQEIHFEGGFVAEGSAELGHRARAARPFEPDQVVEIPVLVLGSGIAGLVAAMKLRQAGVDRLRILELEDAPGGTSMSGRTGALEYPWAAHYLPAPWPEQAELVDLMRELGAITGTDAAGMPEYDEAQLCAAPKERIYIGGFWYRGLYPGVGASAEDHEQIDRFEEMMGRYVSYRDRDGRRAFTLPVAHSSSDKELVALDQLSISQWLRQQGFDSPRLHWYVDYACRDDFGLRAEETSAWAGIHYFCARTLEPGQESAEFLTWPSGNGHLVDKLLERIGRERLELGTVVLSVSPEGDGRRARVDAWNRASGRGTRWIAEHVVFALPSFLRRHVIKGFEHVPDYHPGYAPWIVANVHLRDRPESRGFPVCWDNVIYDSNSLGYVVATHQLHRDRGPTVWTYYLPLPGPDPAAEREKLLSLSYREAADAIVHDLSRAHIGFQELVTRIDVMRWGHAMVRPEVGVFSDPSRQRAPAAIGPIHFAHSDLSGMALFEEAFFHGSRAAREVAKGLGA